MNFFGSLFKIFGNGNGNGRREMAELHEKVNGISDMVSRIDERTQWLDENIAKLITADALKVMLLEHQRDCLKGKQ